MSAPGEGELFAQVAGVVDGGATAAVFDAAVSFAGELIALRLAMADPRFGADEAYTRGVAETFRDMEARGTSLLAVAIEERDR